MAHRDTEENVLDGCYNPGNIVLLSLMNIGLLSLINMFSAIYYIDRYCWQWRTLGQILVGGKLIILVELHHTFPLL